MGPTDSGFGCAWAVLTHKQTHKQTNKTPHCGFLQVNRDASRKPARTWSSSAAIQSGQVGSIACKQTTVISAFALETFAESQDAGHPGESTRGLDQDIGMGHVRPIVDFLREDDRLSNKAGIYQTTSGNGVSRPAPFHSGAPASAWTCTHRSPRRRIYPLRWS